MVSLIFAVLRADQRESTYLMKISHSGDMLLDNFERLGWKRVCLLKNYRIPLRQPMDVFDASLIGWIAACWRQICMIGP